MKISVKAQNRATGEIFDLSDLINSITIENYLYGQAGKMSCLIQKDPNKILNLENGSVIDVIVNDTPMFYGYIFTMGTDATETYKILAYDQMRYLFNPHIEETINQTASQIFQMACRVLDLNNNIRHHSDFICPKYQHINKSLYSIIEYGIHQTLIGTNPNKMYAVRDEFGTLVFFDVSKQMTNLVIGNVKYSNVERGSLLMNYQYETSIDKGTANQVVVYRVDENTNKIKLWGTPNKLEEEPNVSYVRRWGLLRHIEEVGKELNESQIIEISERLLSLKRRETKSMKLNALGLPQLRVGDGFNLSINALGISENVWIDSISHTITKDTHFMQMGVFVI